MEEEFFEQRTDLSKLNAAVEQIKSTIAKVVVGQHDAIDLLIAGYTGRRAYIDRRRARHSENVNRQVDRQKYQCQIFAHTVYTRPDAVGCIRYLGI